MIIDQARTPNKHITKTANILKILKNTKIAPNEIQKQFDNIYLSSHPLNTNNAYNINFPQNSLVKKYVQLFAYKIKRGVGLNKREEVKVKKVWSDIFKTQVQGMQISDTVVSIIVFLSIIATLTCLILATFAGFLDDFSDNYSTRPEVIIIKIICLLFSLFYFIVKCISRFAHGELSIYVHEIFSAYAQSKRIFIDFISIVFQILSLIIPKIMPIQGAFFFFLIIVFIFCLNDINSIETAFFHKQRNILLWGITKIALSNIIFGHLMASFLLAMSRIDLQHNWLIKAQIQNQPWYIIYINSYYWGCTIMMTIGFGDLLPASPGEKIVTSFLEMFSCALLGYNISTIGNLISQLREQNRQANRKRTVFRKMIRQQNGKQSQISKRLQIKILNYIRKSNSGYQNLQYLERDQIIASLPQPMRRAYFRQITVKIFPKVSFFNKLNKNTLLIISEKIVRKSYFPNQYLLNNAFEEIVLLDKGEVGLAYKKKGSKLNGQIYDSFSNQEPNQLKLVTVYPFSIHNKHNYYLISKNYALAWTIKFQKFLQIISENPVDYEYYFKTLHSHPFDPDLFNFKICDKCSNKTNKYLRYHSIYDCPKVTYMPLKQIIISKALKQQGDQQIRKKHRNSSNKKLKWRSTLTKRGIVQRDAQILKQKLKQFTEGLDRFNDQFALKETIKKQWDQKIEFETDMVVDKKWTQQRLKKIMEQVLKKHEVGYSDDFWTLDVDKAQNYRFYFPKFNVIKVGKIKME